MEEMRNARRIAFVVDYIENEYSLKVYAGVSQYAKEHGIEILTMPIGRLNEAEKGYDYQLLSVASLLRPSNVDGIVFLTGAQLNFASVEYVTSYLHAFDPVPIVSIGAAIPDRPAIIASETKGFSAIISHIIEKHGCRRIALMSVNSNSPGIRERVEIFKQVLLSHNIAYDESLVLYGGFSYEIAFRALNVYRDVKGRIDFDAIVALTDEMAYACVDYLIQHQIKVPGDVIVTGFDDALRSSVMVPSLTTVNQNLEAQGYQAVEMLEQLIDGEKVDKLRWIKSFPVLRQSCGCESRANLVMREGTDVTALFTDSSNPLSAAGEWCMKRTQFIQVIHLYTQMQEDMTLEQFRTHINSDLMSMGILSAAVVLFETPVSTDKFEFFSMPQKAFVYSALDRYSGFWLGDQENPIPFNPREIMIPDGIFQSMDGMYVQALYHTTTLYGYLFFKPGSYDSTVYSMVCKMFSNALASAYSMSRSEMEKKRLEREFDVATHNSVTDEMTGLLNRRGFLFYGQKSLELFPANGKAGMVLFGDIDGLKKINDTYGHAAGDTAIKAEASLLRKAFRQSDIIGRLGGDEFAVVAPSLSPHKYEIARRRLEEYCDDWNKTSGEPFTLSISLGNASFEPGESCDINTLLKLADQVLYEEKKKKKEAGKNKK